MKACVSTCLKISLSIRHDVKRKWYRLVRLPLSLCMRLLLPWKQDFKVSKITNGLLRTSMYVQRRWRFIIASFRSIVIWISSYRTIFFHRTSGKIEMGKISCQFQSCYENALVQNTKMSTYLMVHRFHPQTILWSASGSGLEQAGHKRGRGAEWD